MSTSTATKSLSTHAQKLPPIEGISVAVLTLVIIGGVYVAAHLPNHVSLVPAVILTCIAGLLVIVNVILLTRIQNFARKTFFLVAKWALLAYLVIAGMLEYVFIYDGTRGPVLVLLSSTLAIFAFNLPILFGFTVAKFQDA